MLFAGVFLPRTEVHVRDDGRPASGARVSKSTQIPVNIIAFVVISMIINIIHRYLMFVGEFISFSYVSYACYRYAIYDSLYTGYVST